MTLLVQKFGGTSVADVERIAHVARRVVATADTGKQVCVVVSAMGHTTDELLALSARVATAPHPRELDMLLSAGERISMALLAMAIEECGHQAVSFTGGQAGIVTDTLHGKARIVHIRTKRLSEALDRGRICIVAGFQGVSTEDDDTTLGRGGSDMTAVALASALGAEACEILTDVEGVFTADPRLVPTARRLPRLSFEEMLELAASGAGVLMPRSVEVARTHGVPIHVRSSFTESLGTWIGQEGSVTDGMERPIVSAVAHDTSEAKITVSGVPDRPGIAARLFRPLADASINIDMIVQNVSADGVTDISFTLPKSDLARARPLLAEVRHTLGAEALSEDAGIGKVTLVGAGMKSHPGVAADMFDALADAGINIEIISTSPIRISCVVRVTDLERAVRAVHDRFGLAEAAITREEVAGS